MVTAQWCLSLSVQRQSSIHPSTQSQVSVYPSAQRQVWVSSLHKVCDVLYDGSLSLGHLLGATEKPPAHWSGHSIHIGHPIASSFMMQLALMAAMVGANTAAILKGSWGTLWTFSGGGSLCRQSSHSCEARRWHHLMDHLQLLCGWWGVLTWWSVPLTHWACCCWTILSPKLWLWGLCLGPCDRGGICLVGTTGLEWCITSFHPGNQFGGFAFLDGSSVTFAMASLTGESACVGWALSGTASFDWVTEGSSGRAMPLKTSSSDKET